MPTKEVLVSCIMRQLQCTSCQRLWSWVDPTTPRYCPYCGHNHTTVWPVETAKFQIKVPAARDARDARDAR